MASLMCLVERALLFHEMLIPPSSCGDAEVRYFINMLEHGLY